MRRIRIGACPSMRGYLPGMIAVASQGNQLIQMPVVAFVMSVLFLALAWGYLLTGAL